MIKLVVWDWNGTLFNDTEEIVQAVNAELAVFGAAPITVETYREKYTVPIRDALLAMGVDAGIYDLKCSEAVSLFHDRYEEYAATVRLEYGAKAVLKGLQQLNISQVILSNHIIKEIEKHLLRFDIAQYLTDILANDAIGIAQLQGKQFRLSEYLHLHEARPDQVVIIGDTVEEVAIGKSLGLHTIAFPGGGNSAERLAQAEPDLLVGSLSEIIPSMEEKQWL